MNDNHHSARPWLSGFRKGPVSMLACRLALAGLICLLMVPVLRVFAMAGDGGPELAAICTDHGMVRLTVDAEGRTVPAQEAGHPCACCVVAPDHQTDQAALVAGVAPAGVSGTVDGVRIQYPSGVFPERHFLSGRQSRAPPAFV